MPQNDFNIFQKEFLGDFPVRAIRCSNKSMEGQCENEAIAYAMKADAYGMTNAVPAYCGACCLIAIERTTPGDSIIFQRLET